MQAKLGEGTVVDDRFRVEREIGSGGMATVYAARDLMTDLPVALKLLHGAEPDLRARFSLEARVLSDLRHSAIVGFVGYGALPDGAPYLVLEWLEGHDLAEELRRRGGPLALEEAFDIALRLVDALDWVHGHNVLHRDLKPSNVFLRKGLPKLATLIDFGVARSSAVSPLTAKGALVGTPDYMAPEHIRSPTKLAPPTDVYGLGCIVFECLAGAPPFRAKTLDDILHFILIGPPPRLRQRGADVPAAVDDLVFRMMATKPEDRPQTMAQLKTELEAAQTA